jgi:hypothetical protein
MRKNERTYPVPMEAVKKSWRQRLVVNWREQHGADGIQMLP